MLTVVFGSSVSKGYNVSGKYLFESVDRIVVWVPVALKMVSSGRFLKRGFLGTIIEALTSLCINSLQKMKERFLVMKAS
ncbi:hypothetical protein [Mesotoga sp. BH458_6_3_2_1]|uniref:hypothetical protein n=1 Tax=Mesotoga sp. BH458_6_3_2_1 TaxID=1437446 RepID=UPI0016048CD0|nr:hypothetical protein [Mesotoga sp. BH458_6_3_2_1]